MIYIWEVQMQWKKTEHALKLKVDNNRCKKHTSIKHLQSAQYWNPTHFDMFLDQELGQFQFSIASSQTYLLGV